MTLCDFFVDFLKFSIIYVNIQLCVTKNHKHYD
jgi:hypothetical protein